MWSKLQPGKLVVSTYNPLGQTTVSSEQPFRNCCFALVFERQECMRIIWDDIRERLPRHAQSWICRELFCASSRKRHLVVGHRPRALEKGVPRYLQCVCEDSYHGTPRSRDVLTSSNNETPEGSQQRGIQSTHGVDKMASKSSLEYDYLFKIVLVGDAAVGKTNLLACYTSQVCLSLDRLFCERYLETGSFV